MLLFPGCYTILETSLLTALLYTNLSSKLSWMLYLLLYYLEATMCWKLHYLGGCTILEATISYMLPFLINNPGCYIIPAAIPPRGYTIWRLHYLEATLSWRLHYLKGYIILEATLSYMLLFLLNFPWCYIIPTSIPPGGYTIWRLHYLEATLSWRLHYLKGYTFLYASLDAILSLLLYQLEATICWRLHYPIRYSFCWIISTSILPGGYTILEVTLSWRLYYPSPI